MARKTSTPVFPLEGGDARRPVRALRAPAKTSDEVKTDAQFDLFDRPPSPPPPPPPRTHISPEEAPLTLVSLREAATMAKAADQFLYMVARQDEAAIWQSEGLKLDPRAPLGLAERPAVLPWLQREMENDADEGLCVLRVRRALLNEWLEPDPDQSAQFGAMCYLLCHV
ncbi:hypothetical protein ABUE34_06420 [Kozakia baliensis]|uniref:hypothetical protein n=1 Tax=Kozakia baliensis TaxID=153496 RepID=UPI00345B9EE3